MSEMWSYQKARSFDDKGNRWHFVTRHILELEIPFDEQPYEVYFRNNERTEFGLLRFEKRKENPYRNYEVIINKIMNNDEFRKTLLNSEMEEIWNRNWK
jgi:hypothetical protein